MGPPLENAPTQIRPCLVLVVVAQVTSPLFGFPASTEVRKTRKRRRRRCQKKNIHPVCLMKGERKGGREIDGESREIPTRGRNRWNVSDLPHCQKKQGFFLSLVSFSHSASGKFLVRKKYP